ncbi:hypothetical protein [Pseudomonas aegrilactucae]|uniref:Halovibrin HvnA n=1 Tax=Pseudomonas aegrilactucae TaxID=2854028 RepID=A0A9Q2XG86_9PSED|nr:hypothetical protein [Pseudomonas aegrilactucae]MBV6286138.1 hypothetical protein [Pseudomonas aegrilactucae]
MSIIWRVCVALMLSGHGALALAEGGVEVARQLNARYNHTPAQCVGRTPAFSCSGVLLRGVPATFTGPFWTSTDPGSSTLRFEFLRKDRPPASLSATSGYLLFDRLTAVGRNTPYQGSQVTGSPGVVQVDAGASVQAVAVQGLFYDTLKAGGLPQAQRSQVDYFKATGVWLPVLRLQRNDAQGQVFGFSQSDQVSEGYRVAQRLNVRYGATDMRCRNGNSAFDCNGVLLRSTGVGSFHAWNPGPYSVGAGAVSFSYLRRDASITLVVWPQGYLIRELAAPATYPLRAGCFFPADGATHYSGTTYPCTFRGWCEQRNPPVASVADWTASFAGDVFGSCAFRPQADYVQLMMDLRRTRPGFSGWNEIMIDTWPQDIALKLPIEAFFYSLNSYYKPAAGAVGGLGGGQTFQRDYFQQTGRTLALVRLDVLASNGQPFSFDPAVQALP